MCGGIISVRRRRRRRRAGRSAHARAYRPRCAWVARADASSIISTRWIVMPLTVISEPTVTLSNTPSTLMSLPTTCTEREREREREREKERERERERERKEHTPLVRRVHVVQRRECECVRCAEGHVWTSTCTAVPLGVRKATPTLTLAA